MSTCLSVNLSIFVSAHLSTCLTATCLSVYLSSSLPFYLSSCLFFYLSTCLSFHLSTCLFFYLPIFLLVYLSTCLSIHCSTWFPTHWSTCSSIYLFTSSHVYESIIIICNNHLSPSNVFFLNFFSWIFKTAGLLSLKCNQFFTLSIWIECPLKQSNRSVLAKIEFLFFAQFFLYPDLPSHNQHVFSSIRIECLWNCRRRIISPWNTRAYISFF